MYFLHLAVLLFVLPSKYFLRNHHSVTLILASCIFTPPVPDRGAKCCCVCVCVCVEAHTQPCAWHIGIPVVGSGSLGLLLAVRAY